MSNYTIDILLKMNDQASASMKKVSKNLTSFAEKNKETFQNMAVQGGIAFGVLTAGILKSGTMASDAEEVFNKFNVVFASVGDQAEAVAQDLRKNYGLAESSAKDMLSATGGMLTGFGLTGEAALSLAEKTNKLAVDLASFTNFSGGAKGASEALTKALLGERESVKALNIAIMEEDVKAKVASMRVTGELTNETDRQARAMATLSIAYDQSKNAIGDFERTQAGFANQQRILDERTKELTETFGTVFLPVLNKVVSTIMPIVLQLSDWIKNNQELTKNIVLVAAGLAGLVTILGTIGLVLPSVIAGIKMFGAAISLGLGPIGILISLSTLLAVQIYRNWDNIVKITEHLGNKIKDIFGSVGNFIMGLGASAYTRGSNMLNMFIDGFYSKVDDLKNGVMGVAQTIKDFLGFSSPTKEGPGSNADKWIPNLISMMASGFDEGSIVIQRAVGKVARGMQEGLNMDNLKKSIEGLQVEAISAFDKISQEITGHKSKVTDLANEYKALEKELGNINDKILGIQSQGKTDIAGRAVQIQGEIAGINQKLSDSTGSINESEKETLALKMQSLQAELEIAKANTTQVEMDEIRRQNGLSETERLIEQMNIKLEEAEREKEEIVTQMEMKKKAVQEEMKNHITLVNLKKSLDKAYFDFFSTQISRQQNQIRETISLLMQMQSAGGGSGSISGARADGGPVTQGNTYLVGERGPELFTPRTSGQIISNESMQGSGGGITINMGGVSVSNNADEDRLVEKIKNMLIVESRQFNYGIA